MPDGLPGLISAAAAASYIWGAVLIFLATRADRQPAFWHLLIVSAGWLLHGLLLFQDVWLSEGRILQLGIADALSVCSWISSGLLILLTLKYAIANLGLMLYPVAAFCLLLGTWAPNVYAPVADAGWIVELHVLLSLFAYGFLSLAALLAIALGIQDRSLRRHHPHGYAAALPPLETTERLMYQWIGTGFALLTLALLSGLFFVENWLAQHLAHKIVLSIIAWLLFGALLIGRRWRGWRGQRGVYWALAGYTVLVLAYFGSKFVLEALLQTPWDAA